jgi:fatty aldehyde-generating acyl-ACP reductase
MQTVVVGRDVAIGLPAVLDFSGTIESGVVVNLELTCLDILSDLRPPCNTAVSIQFCFAADFAYMNLSGHVSAIEEEDGTPSRIYRLKILFQPTATERAILESCIMELAPPSSHEHSVRTADTDPRSIMSLFVTDNPYLLHYRRKGPVEKALSAIMQPPQRNGLNGHQINQRVNGKVSRFIPGFSWRSLPVTAALTVQVLRDGFIRWLPRPIARLLAPTISFAFIAHPRDLSDIPRKFPLAYLLPARIAELWFRYQWPFVASYITGLRTKSGRHITGAMLISPPTTKQMVQNPRLARTRVIQTARLAEKMGARIVGLGAFTSIVTRDGQDLLGKVDVGVTTGNAHSAAIAVQNVVLAASLTNLSLPHATAAVVGGAGSVGSACAKLLAPVTARMILVDIKRDALRQVAQILRDQSRTVETSSSVDIVRQADVVIVATNSPHVLITADHLKPGAIIIDAAQPKNVSETVPVERRDVLVIESAVVKTPDVDCHFDLDLGHGEALGCLSETMLLAAIGWEGHYSLGKAHPRQAADMIAAGRSLGFRLAYFRNSSGYITEDHLLHVAKARLKSPSHV